MRTDERGMRCDGCGYTMEKVHRVYGKERFCVTCYARIFKRRLCKSCGNYARLPNDNATCSQCERAKPCVRCGRTGRPIGRISEYGPVCNSCSRYFVDPKPCSQCGELSHHLAQHKRLGVDGLLCPPCARTDFGTCQACRRHRLLTRHEDGRELCKKCVMQPALSCKGCGQDMPAGRGDSLCEPCYWTQLCHRRLDINSAAFSLPTMAELFRAFGSWLLACKGPNRAALLINGYLEFFKGIEDKWGEIPSYQKLVDHYGADELRKVRLPMRWLSEAGHIIVDARAKAKNAAQCSIANLLRTLPQDAAIASVVDSYHQSLLAKADEGRTTLRSVKLALTPAVKLMLHAHAQGAMLPAQMHVQQYLEEFPGQRAAVTGFVNYIKKHAGLDLRIEEDPAATSLERKRRKEKQLLKLVPLAAESDEFIERWLQVALECFHDVSSTRSKALVRDGAIERAEDGFTIVYEKQTYWVPYWAYAP